MRFKQGLFDAAVYDGENHEPNHVRLLGGSLIFCGRLESMSVEYTLFKPSGKPLRANRSSPDLSHVIEVKAGDDALPLLCDRVYKDCSCYLEVARVNHITHFRDIAPGRKLHFPPLR